MTATQETGADQQAAETSEWQKRIAGEWHGRPGLFDAQGNHVGFERVDRASVVEDGVARYWMNTTLEGGGPLRNRLELGAHFDFGIVDSDQNRVYCGPDFYGTGQPYGLFVDANYYSPGWQADLRTWNQVLPDGNTQVYSSVLYDGWSVCAVFNGVYQRTFDHATNPATQQFVEDWIALETSRGARPQVLPTKEAGAWRGTLFVNPVDQSEGGEVEVTIEHQPLDLRRARQQVTWSGALDRSYGFQRYRDGARTQYEGPEVFGNAQSFGRALFTTQHLVGPDATGVEKIRGREFLIDADNRDLAIVWQLMSGDATTHFVHGALTWESA
ncbi:hypothetical protein E8D34_07085 [Nocardioides sp. GY 10113]|uniref:hypothetical protein n=1 Tax=Nocardioides sp. GY 10113 TaxID=2569761 RepID=UPI0010A7722D|nr:hypothetical protein [Nocardioides sp. GY 10113]TIC88045.1 hypothetical protein E8D34_07085 [Nocardioides sp. GY 10113]